MNQINGCQIWTGNEGVGYQVNLYSTYVETSPRAGGRYAITRPAILMIQDGELYDSHKARLTTRLIDLRKQGVEWPEVTPELIEQAKTASALPIHQRADRLLSFLAESTGSVAGRIGVTASTLEAYAWSESTSWQEVDYFLHYLARSGWLEGDFFQGGFDGQVSVDGHRRIAELGTNQDSSKAFVAMWFDDSVADAQRDGIEAGIRDAGFNPLAINRKEHINKIEDEVIAEIRRSRFLVADFTHGKDGARGSVYYEAGFAHGLGLPVIFTCHQDDVANLHFDTSHYSHIVWTDPADLREKLKNRILAVIV